MSGLISPLLEQAGFASGALESAIDYIARPDGLSQYWVLSEPIDVQVNDVLYIDFLGGLLEEGKTKYFLGDPSYKFSAFAMSNSQNIFDGFGTSPFIDEQPIVNEVTPIPTSEIHTLKIEVSRAASMICLGAKDDRGSTFINIPIFNFKHVRNGEVLHEIELTNKNQGATQLPKVGNVSATMSNFSSDVWEVKPSAGN